jgi:hypothetical protein
MKNKIIALLLVVVMVASVFTAVGVVTAKPVPQLTKTELTISAPKTVNVRQTFTIQGTLTSGGAGVAGSVTIYRNVGDKKWTPIGPAPTNAQGAYSLQTSESAAGTYKYRAEFVGDATHKAATSKDIDVKVTAVTPPTLVAPQLQSPSDGATFNVGDSVGFSWTQVTGATGYAIAIEKQGTDGTWVSYTSSSVSGTSKDPFVWTEAGAYRWHAQATASNVVSPWSDYRSFTVTPLPLEKPTLVDPSDQSFFTVGATIAFSWNQVSGATGYTIAIEKQGTNGWQAYADSGPISVTSWSKQVTESGMYRWQVQAIRGSDSSSSDYRTFTVTPLPLEKPTLLFPSDGASYNVGDPIVWSWNPVPSATGYTIAIEKQKTDGTWESDASSGVSGTSKGPFAWTESGVFRWHVQATDGSITSPWSDWRTFTVTEPLVAPQLLTPSDRATFNVGDVITWTWTPVQRATGYEIVIEKQAPDGAWAYYTGSSASGTSHGPFSWVTSGEFRWHMRATDGTLWSSWSDYSSFTVTAVTPPTPNPPQILTPENNAQFFVRDEPSVSWTAVTGATQYYIEIEKQGTGGGWTVSGLTDPIQGTDTSIYMYESGTYRWHVTAYNNNQVQAWSDYRYYTVVELQPPTLQNPQDGAFFSVNQPIHFSWDPATGADRGYWVEFLKDWGGGEYSYYRSEFVSAPATSLDLTFTEGGNYKWHVYSEGSNGAGSQNSEERSFTVNSVTLKYAALVPTAPSTPIYDTDGTTLIGFTFSARLTESDMSTGQPNPNIPLANKPIVFSANYGWDQVLDMQGHPLTAYTDTAGYVTINVYFAGLTTSAGDIVPPTSMDQLHWIAEFNGDNQYGGTGVSV